MTRLLHSSAVRPLVTAVVAVVLVALAVLAGPPAPAHAAAPSTGRYVPLDTSRVFAGTVGTTPRVVPVAGTGGVPANATAVVVNVEVANPTAAGYVRVTAAGTDAQVATQEFGAGQSISNLATVKLAPGGVQLKLSAGSATVFLDVSGYYVDGDGATYTPVAASRVFRQQVGTSPVAVPLAGAGGIPDDATAVAVNTQVEATTANGYVRVTPAGQDPAVAAQVYTAGAAVSNLVIVKLVGGAAQVKVSAGTAVVSMDVTGYYSDSDTGSVFVPIDTTRAYAGPVTTTPRSIRLTGTAGVPGTATAVVANAETEKTTSGGYLRITPAGTDAQVATQVFRAGQAISNLTMTGVTGSTADRRVQAKVSAGSATLDLDVSGYFMDGSTGAGTGADVSWPQCDAPSSWPADAAFGIVGVNDGIANTTNPCFAEQRAWAEQTTGGAGQAQLQLYVNTANPGNKASVWPRSNTVPNGPTLTGSQNPYGVCTGAYDLACTFMYGYTRAYEDGTVRGVADPGAHRWWLDAETDGTWQSSTALNRASLEGMTAYFTSVGGSVGLYSSPAEWTQLFGSVPQSSSLYSLPTWRPIGTGTLAAAQAACSSTPFKAGGRVEMTQYQSAGVLRDVSCV
ncbi:hypothetical protein [Curtobacterium sp. VKM Ac-2922]|uniref:hypothetical protein n=1 Tax=Curtobacterium sp. VKM Ac-2922 TaxID=2929475 RepID=UPI001FB54B5C|nr:hypothetical protein [Curtobacterium sp. VKM Ac-2922]MCJ1713352.1 hypothetical protein [Curtobacterium sp. VKM Ac-2922]